jgi:hypothetical protein
MKIALMLAYVDVALLCWSCNGWQSHQFVLKTNFYRRQAIRISAGNKYDHLVALRSSSRVVARNPIQFKRKVDEPLENLSLDFYMRLPVDSYVVLPLPYGIKLERLPSKGKNGRPSEESYCGAKTDNYFLLRVPPVEFPGIMVEPKVYCTVQTPDEVFGRRPAVVVRSCRCVLSGDSPIIAATKLNERFTFEIETCIKWDEATRDSNDAQGTRGISPCQQRTLTAESKLEVKVDPPSLFRVLLPKRALESVGRAAMSFAVKQVESCFINALMNDYEDWAGNPHDVRRKATSTAILEPISS